MAEDKGRIERSAFFFALAAATLLSLWLRAHAITAQVVLDDEWHALHKLVSSSYGEILTSFGLADHSIPLTLLYKAMADTVGLAEGRLRALQVACGVALVPLGAWLAWRATRDGAAAALFAFLLAGAPFLVMWSRFARPYAIALLLSVACVAAIWRWRSARTAGMAGIAALAAALAAWFHPVFGIYAAVACLFVFVEDALAVAGVGRRPAGRSLRLGLLVAAAMALPLAAPLAGDAGALSAKAGGDYPDAATLGRSIAIVWGGVPTPIVAAAWAAAAWGVVTLARRDARLALYLVCLAVVPGAALALSGALWLHMGQNFLRYQLGLLPIGLFFAAVGTIHLVRAAVPRHRELAAWTAAGALSVAYLAATPAIAQVATLGPWYAHIEYHWDYRYRWMAVKRGDPAYQPPAFYRKLGAMAPGSAPVIEAPFIWEAPRNALAFYATHHAQGERFGMLHDLCLEGPRIGEVPPGDRRFRFRSFLFLQDVPAVRGSGARYLLLHLDPPAYVGPRFDVRRCLARLTELYGPPAEIDERLAVFTLRP